MKELIFQAVDWKSFDTKTLQDYSDYHVYRVIIFGRTLDGKTVTCVVDDFKPYLLICIPNEITEKGMDVILQKIKQQTKGTGCVKYEYVTGLKYSTFSNYQKHKFAKLYFQDSSSMSYASYVFDNSIYICGKLQKLELFESNIPPMLKIIHERNLNSTGMIKISDYIQLHVPGVNNIKDREYRSNISITTSYKNLVKYDTAEVAPLIIASFDIECVSESGDFPKPTNKNDNIIQIGTTFNYLNNDNCFKKHISTLGGCNKIEDNVDIDQCKTEKQVILKWVKILKKINPDIIVGHNIYGFDYKYIYKRAKLLGIDKLIEYNLGRIKYIGSLYSELKLSSSALGDNKFFYYDIPGIVNFDFMKVMANDPGSKMDSYSLDSISNTYIREPIIKIIHRKNASILLCKNCLGLTKDRYVKIISMNNSGGKYHEEGKKFKIIEIKSIEIDGNKYYEFVMNKKMTDIIGFNSNGELKDRKFPVLWCKAKDDMPPQELFKKQKGSNSDRAEIAKYCIQDCVLVNVLMEKLKVVMKSIAIAGVCNVPLSYVHLRGQGAKIFSLVIKFCNEKNYYVPVLKKEKKEMFTTGIIEQEFADTTSEFNSLVDTTNDISTEDMLINTKSITRKLMPYEKQLKESQLKIAREKYGKVKSQLSIIKNSKVFNKKEAAKIPELQEQIDNLKEKYGNLLYDEKAEKEKKRYDGAMIIPPIPGVFYDAIGILDFLSLYPSSLIHRNMSAESLVLDEKYMNLHDHNYYRVVFFNKKNEKCECVFAKKKDGTKAIIPSIEEYLLRERSNVKKQMKTEKNSNKYSMLDALQYAYKIVANSLYGQTGSDFSGIYNLSIAASTTATGREMLIFAKLFAEIVFGKVVHSISNDYIKKIKTPRITCESLILHIFNKNIDKFIGSKQKIAQLKKKKMCNIPEYEYFKIFYERYHSLLEDDIVKQKKWISDYYDRISNILEHGKYTSNVVVVYGDTDSIFPNFNIIEVETNKKMENEKGLMMTISLAQACSDFINLVLPEPHNLQYEKTFWPFCIISKKRYTANKYEFSPDKYYQVNMGTVIKRRDNAPITKTVIGGIIDILLNERNPEKALKFTEKTVADILSGNISIDNFIISKSVKEHYKDRSNQAQVVTMDKRKQRDKGDVVHVGDRVPFVYVYQKESVEKKGKKEGKIKRSTTADDPIYVAKNNIPVDFEYYVSNQIRKPATTFLQLISSNADKIFDRLLIKYKNEKIGRINLMDYEENESGIDISDYQPQKF